MDRSVVNVLTQLILMWGVLALAGCGGGSGGGGLSTNTSDTADRTFSSDQRIIQPPQFLSGAGIKGPLAHATVELFALDSRFKELYDPNHRLSTATTDAYAQFDGLPVPGDVPPPYILLIDGSNAIDLNTGVAPVITKLVTVITKDTLNSSGGVYATPYTTLAYNMLIQEFAIGGFGDLKFTGGDSAIQQHQNGLVSLEVEDFDANLPKNGHQWVDRALSGYSGTGALSSMPDIDRAYYSNYAERSPRLDYSINFTRTGTHYVWIRGKKESGRSDSLHLGLDGIPVTGGYQVIISTKHLGWSNQKKGGELVRIDVPTVGVHTLNIWMREDGAIIDKIVLTTDVNFTPSGTGPAANSREDTSIASTVLLYKLKSFSQRLIDVIGFGIPTDVDLFSTPPIITSDTDTVEEQQLVVQYRGAIEALSSLLYELSRALAGAITADDLLVLISNDVYDDEEMNTLSVSAVATAIFFQNPMTIQIANTQYQVKDIVALMDEERVYISDASSVEFHRDEIFVDLLPLQSEGSVEIQIKSEPEPSGGSTETTVEAPKTQEFTERLFDAETLLQVNFNKRSIGSYAQADIIADFQIGINGYNDYLAGTNYNSMDIVEDPAGTGRGNVMRVRHNANTGGNGLGRGGMSFRADFEKQNDVYMAYDLYLPLDHEWTKIVKHPGIITGTMQQASHGSIAPEAEGLLSFSSLVTSDSPPAWPNRGYGALSAYYYNADEVQKNQFWNELDPNSEDYNNQYNQPLGRWITIEMRVKMNTVTEEGVSGRKDGLLEIWITDPQSTTGARKVSSDQHRWRLTNSMGADGIWMVNYYGGKASSDDNRPSKDNYHYYDNFIVSSAPITH